MERPVSVIAPRKGRVRLELGEVWRFRELIYFLVWRDVKVRYKQTLLGASWALIQPLVAMVIFSIVFGRLVGVPSNGLPYPVFALAALVPWTFFSQGVAQAANSLVGNQELLKKVYFPRLAIPIAAVLSGIVDLAIAFALLLALMPVFGIVPSLAALVTLPLLALAGVAALGVGIGLSALNVRFRDVRHVVPFFLQVLLFATPVAYPSTLLNDAWRPVYALNPMVGVIDGIRWSLGADVSPLAVVGPSILSSAALLIVGVYYFRLVDGTIADVI